MTLRAIAASLVVIAACDRVTEAPERTGLDPFVVASGYDFLTPETQALQDDAFANPGLLWVDRGEALFHGDDNVSRPCSACHTTESLEQSAASFPKIDPDTGALLNLEGRINLCRETHQNAPALPYESEDLLSLTAYIANLSNGAPVRVQRTPQTQSYFDAGADYFFTRRGQLNLSCHHCHDDNWGKQLRGDTISQGHGNGFPTYRLEWQTLGSLHRRFRDCDAGVRAEPKALGSETYLALEFYLAARGAGLSIESPSVRR